MFKNRRPVYSGVVSMSCNKGLCSTCGSCLGMITRPCKRGKLQDKFEAFDRLIGYGNVTKFSEGSPYAMVRYDIKPRLGRDDKPKAKIIIYDFKGLENEHHFIDGNKNEWAVIDGSIVYFDNGVRFDATAVTKSKRVI